MDAPTTGLRIADLRKLRFMSQERLAIAAGLSTSTIQKLEEDECPGARLATLHRIARVLQVTTGELFTPPVEPRATPPTPDGPDTFPLRYHLAPPVGEAVTGMDRLRRELAAADRYVADDDYAAAIATLAAAIPSARLACETATNGNQQAAQALLLRAYDLSSQVMILVHDYTVAGHALTAMRALADATGDPLHLAQAVFAGAWLQLREGRFEQLVAEAETVAAELEPTASGETEPRRVAAWGALMCRIAGAASRNNHTDLWTDACRRARMAAGYLGEDYARDGIYFGPTRAAYRQVEDLVIQDRMDDADQMLRGVPPAGAVLPRDVNRHRLDVARIQLERRRPDDALQTLLQIRRDRPQWMRHQSLALDVTRDVMARRRTFPPELRDLADYLQVPV